MRKTLFVSTVFCLLLLMTGCDRLSESKGQKFTVTATNTGKVIRLNTVTGETCIVDENCDTDRSVLVVCDAEVCDADISALVTGESYIYKGNGKFQRQETIDFNELE